ncbi:MAG: response regulator transcription factor [Gemmatimonadetes bacterium]|nr:response regulator transcription factor [Gemmatimonadota bacterium]
MVIIEDEPDIVEVLAYNLSREGYNVLPAPDGETGWSLVSDERPDLVLLDLMLPGLDGLEVCRRLKGDRRTSSIPVIMVTAKGEESDVVLGLGVGADDYITKPFSPKELVARVKAVLRRGHGRLDDVTQESVDLDSLRIDPSRHQVTVDGSVVEFTRMEFRILHLLASDPGHVFSRQALLDHAAGPDAVVIDRSIDVHINAIRKKLGSLRDYVRTVRGVGYKFESKNA